MKILCCILISISIAWADDSGLRYEKDKVCEQLNGMGKQAFTGLFIAVYSQKFPNSTLKEVTCLVDEMLKLGERCCVEEASADCYDKGATAISDKSCQADSPFPKHPGTAKCCAKEDVHEKKMCLAALHYSADELPSMLEPSNEEMCKQYTQDPAGYSSSYMYELARRHRSVPTGLVLNATNNQLRMLKKCCTPSSSNACFFTEFTGFQRALCNESLLATMSEEFQKCCRKTPLETLQCVENLKRQPQSLPDIKPLSASLCQPASEQESERYLFQIGARWLSASLPIISTALNDIKNKVMICCSEPNIQTCMEQEDEHVKKVINLLSKADEICSQYFKLDFPAFKVMVERDVQGDGDQAAARAKDLVELGSACCFQHSPARRCQTLMEKLISYEKTAAV